MIPSSIIFFWRKTTERFLWGIIRLQHLWRLLTAARRGSMTTIISFNTYSIIKRIKTETKKKNYRDYIIEFLLLFNTPRQRPS